MLTPAYQSSFFTLPGDGSIIPYHTSPSNSPPPKKHPLHFFAAVPCLFYTHYVTILATATTPLLLFPPTQPPRSSFSSHSKFLTRLTKVISITIKVLRKRYRQHKALLERGLNVVNAFSRRNQLSLHLPNIAMESFFSYYSRPSSIQLLIFLRFVFLLYIPSPPPLPHHLYLFLHTDP